MPRRKDRPVEEISLAGKIIRLIPGFNRFSNVLEFDGFQATQREFEALKHRSAGMSLEDIAANMGNSRSSVKNLLHELRLRNSKKLNGARPNSTDAITMIASAAREYGLLDTEVTILISDQTGHGTRKNITRS